MEELNREVARLENRELAKQGPTLPVNGDTRNLSIAVETTKIRQASIEEIKQLLRYAMVKIGLRAQNWPTDLEKQVLIEHIWKEYGGHGIDEIKLAFDMAIAGKLEVDANCYENFSCLYFSNVMAAYRAWAKEEYKQIDKPVAEALPAPKEDLSDKAMEDWATETKRRILHEKYTVNLIPLMLYDWLEKSGRMFRGKGEKKEYMQKAFNYIRMDLITALEKKEDMAIRTRLNEFNDMKERNVFKSNEIENIRTLAKKMIAYDFLKDEFKDSIK